MTPTPKVYEAIAEMTAIMSQQGIAKDRNNSQQHFKFRGVDDVMNALSPHLAATKLCILPRVIDRHVMERQSKGGGTLIYTTLTVEFDLVSAVDGSKHTICTVGEAMDSGDKSSNKAMSAAYKYACLQAFSIPTEGDNDTDAQTHTVTANAEPAKPAVPLATAAQISALEDFSVSDAIEEKMKARILVLLADHKHGKLTKAKAAQALTALTEKK